MEFRPNRAQRTRGRQLASCQIYTQALLEYVIIMWLRSVIKMLREISRADWSDKSDWYCWIVHCFQNIWFIERTHPNEHQNVYLLSTKQLITCQLVTCAANQGVVVCGRSVYRKGLCINEATIANLINTWRHAIVTWFAMTGWCCVLCRIWSTRWKPTLTSWRVSLTRAKRWPLPVILTPHLSLKLYRTLTRGETWCLAVGSFWLYFTLHLWQFCFVRLFLTEICPSVYVSIIYTVNHKKTWHVIFDYNFGQS